MTKYKFIKDCLEAKAGEVKEVSPAMVDVLKANGYIIDYAEPKKAAKTE